MTGPPAAAVVALPTDRAAEAAALAVATGVAFGDAASWRHDPTAGEVRLAALAPGRPEDAATLVGVAAGRVVVDEAEVLVVAVPPAGRRQGVGTALTAALVASLEALGAARVTLEVRPGNGPAVALYARLGFVEVGRRHGYYADGEDALLLARTPATSGA